MRIKEKGLALPLQDRFSVFNNNELLPALAKACDQLVKPGQRIRIDSLEIDVGAVSIDKLESTLREKIVEQFENQLREMVIKNPMLVETVPDVRDIPSVEETETKHELSTKIDLFLFFLEQGTIPWWYSVTAFNTKDIAKEVLSHSPRLFLKKIVPLLHSRNTRLRLVDTLTDKQIQQLIDPDNKFDLKHLWKEIKLSFNLGFFAPHTFNKIRLIIFEGILSELSLKENIAQRPKRLKTAILQSLFNLRLKPLSGFLKSGKIPFKKIKENTLLSKLTEDLSRRELEPLFKNLAAATIDKDEVATLIRPETEDKSSPLKKIRENTFIEINNAGVIILWPYLEMFFKELDLVKNKTFIDEPSRWKAVQLLHYLAFGSEVSEEHEWALNKVLCGMQTSDFVPEEFELSNEEREECNNLLKSVVRNWKALKNTSAEGLQQAFLQRNGLLKNDPDGYLIEIERTAIDVLLDKLSWSISIIKLPWNKGLIHIKW